MYVFIVLSILEPLQTYFFILTILNNLINVTYFRVMQCSKLLRSCTRFEINEGENINCGFVTTYKTTRCHNPEYPNRYFILFKPS